MVSYVSFGCSLKCEKENEKIGRQAQKMKNGREGDEEKEDHSISVNDTIWTNDLKME